MSRTKKQRKRRQKLLRRKQAYGITAQASPERTNSRGPQEQIPQEQRVVHTLLSRVWTTFGALLLIVGGIASVLYFRPDISVEPFVPLDSTNLFSTQFRVFNNSPYAVRDVAFSCQVRRIETQPPLQIILKDIELHKERVEIGSILSKESATTSCPVLEGLSAKAADIEIRVDFRPSWWPFRKQARVRFEGVVGPDNNLHWINKALSESN